MMKIPLMKKPLVDVEWEWMSNLINFKRSLE